MQQMKRGDESSKEERGLMIESVKRERERKEKKRKASLLANWEEK